MRLLAGWTVKNELKAFLKLRERSSIVDIWLYSC